MAREDHKGTLTCWTQNDLSDGLQSSSSSLSFSIMHEFFRHTFLAWLVPIFRRGFSLPLKDEDVPPLLPEQQAKHLHTLFAPFQDDVSASLRRDVNADAKPAPRLFKHLYVAALNRAWCLAIGLQLIHVVASLLASSFVFSDLLDYLAYINNEAEDVPLPNVLTGSGPGIAVLFIALQVISIFCLSAAGGLQALIDVRVKTVLCQSIYEKMLRLNNKSALEYSSGFVTTLSTQDAQNISHFLSLLPMIIMQPPLLFFATALLVLYFKKATLAAITAAVIIGSCQALCARRAAKFQMKWLASVDRLTQSVQEVLSAPKFIKLRAWEDLFEKSVGERRNRQMECWRKFCVTMFMYFAALATSLPIIMSTATFITFALMNKSLPAALIFPGLQLFAIILVPSITIRTISTLYVQAAESWKRMYAYLVADEIKTNSEDAAPTEGIANTVVSLSSANFRWESPPPAVLTKKQRAALKSNESDEKADIDEKKAPQHFTLENLSCSIEQGTLTAVVGSVGSGKTSFISALLGDMSWISGNFHVPKYIAYSAQQPWVINGTLRENILFGLPMDDSRYNKVIAACCLDADIAMMEHKDMTQVGEKGCSLSGGQRARVSLGRAIYADADLYLLDDCLSALDAAVGKRVFEKCMKQFLMKKAVIFVTHKLEILPEVDSIILMSDGKIAVMGSYEELSSQSPAFAQMMSSVDMTNDEKVEAKADAVDAKTLVDQTDEAEDDAPLETDNSTAEDSDVEQRATGSVSWDTYGSIVTYFGGIPWMMAFVASFLVSNGVRCFLDIWLTFWSTSSTGGYTPVNMSNEDFLTYYAILNGLQVVLTVVINGVTLYGGLRFSKKYYPVLFKQVLRSPLQFLDSQPSGRILNRFTQDAVESDLLVTGIFDVQIFTGMLLGKIAVILYTGWVLIAVVVPVLVLFFAVQLFYRRSNREIKRLNAAAKSPVLSSLSEAFDGITSIRGFKMKSFFVKRYQTRLDRSGAINLLYLSCSPWIKFYMGLLSVVLLAAVVGLAFARTTSPELIGLAVTYAIDLSSISDVLLNTWVVLEGQLTSYERVEQYIGGESEREGRDDVVEATWPEQGEIEIRDLELRYSSRPELPALKNVNVSFPAGKKIGVVGRTGSGKSTLLAALTRLIEPCAGKILIDGVDTSELDLKVLRERIITIPQEPFLFGGTLRSNLDPRGTASDAQLWDALAKCGMKDWVADKNHGLDFEIETGCQNLSLGQKQLLVLGSVLLRKPAVLLLDEATASLDSKSDALLQDTIRKECGDVTVISVAHRLHTLSDFDKILVMNHGSVEEYDTPHTLLSDSESAYSRLVDDSGSGTATMMRQAALAKESASA